MESGYFSDEPSPLLQYDDDGSDNDSDSNDYSDNNHNIEHNEGTDNHGTGSSSEIEVVSNYDIDESNAAKDDPPNASPN